MTNPDTPIRLLIVDDDDVDREITRRALKRMKRTFHVTEVSDGEAAIEMWRDTPIDCVLLDYWMQGMNGDEVFQQMMMIRPDTAIAAIFLTGHSDDTQAGSLIKAGACDYVSKHEMTPDVLSRAIDYALARKCHFEQLNYLATRDILTGLPNRALFSLFLEQAIARTQREQKEFALFLLDMDRFKNVNDTLGHHAGDQVLVETAQRLESLIQTHDTVARLGGDEFAVLADLVHEGASITALAERISLELQRSFVIDGQECYLGASVGIALGPKDGKTSEELLRNADLAQAKAKQDGLSRYFFFDEDMRVLAERRRQIETSLRYNRWDTEFDVYYQPRIDPIHNRVASAEALLRWQHPTLGTISPIEFIPIAESSRQIASIGRWILKKACLHCAEWQHSPLKGTGVSVNVSPIQLKDARFAEVVADALAETGLSASLLELEVTETAVMDNQTTVVEALNELAAIGVGISIDDFGTGYSSLARLHRLPVDKIKIDRSFVTDLMHDRVSRLIIESIISLGNQMNITIVAEGVEDETTLQRLVQLGCYEIQGYYFSRPLPFDHFVEWGNIQLGIDQTQRIAPSMPSRVFLSQSGRFGSSWTN